MSLFSLRACLMPTLWRFCLGISEEIWNYVMQLDDVYYILALVVILHRFNCFKWCECWWPSTTTSCHSFYGFCGSRDCTVVLKLYQIEHGSLAIEVRIVGWNGCYVWLWLPLSPVRIYGGRYEHMKRCFRVSNYHDQCRIQSLKLQ